MNSDFTPPRILQITDTHLFADDRALLHGINTRDSLQRVLQQLAQQPRPDLVLVTGDLVHDGSSAGYRALFDMLQPLAAPVAVIAGNHDDPGVLRANLPEQVRFGGVHMRGNWHIVLLHSQVAGQPHGHLDNSELDLLESVLGRAHGSHVLVVLHHHPVPVGSAWLDRIALDNQEALFALLKRFPTARAVLCGHVHQELDTQAEGIRILATPSTGVQFRPHTTEFTLDKKPAGMRWLTLNPDGTIKTKTQRLQPARRRPVHAVPTRP